MKYPILQIFKHLSWTVLHLECSAGLVPDREFGSRSKELQLCSVRLDHVGGPVSVTAHPAQVENKNGEQASATGKTTFAISCPADEKFSHGLTGFA